MKALKKHKHTWMAGLFTLILTVPILISLYGCTDLNEEVFGAITAENFYQTDEEVIAAMAPVYAQLRNTLGDYHNMTQVSSDETLVPTRGSDWFDGGVWLDSHRHTWNPNHPHLNGAWVGDNTGIARANAVLETLDGSDKDQVIAELRALRAFYYYQLMDMFGGVPIVGDDEWTVDPKNPPPRNTRTEVFNFIEQELTAARASLPDQYDASGYGRMTKGACDAMLANIYLNAEVFTGTVTAGGLQAGAARWQDAVAAVDRVINSGLYQLEANWFDNFDGDNSSSAEHIFIVAHLAESGLGVNFVHRALHYSQFTPSPWNGFATLAETFYAFDQDDQRMGIFLEGDQVNVETGDPVNNRQNERLNFTPEIVDITDATEGEGVRIYKFPADPNHVGPDNGNDYAFFRLAEMYLIKAEALNELNGPNQESIDLINTLRARVFEPDEPIALADYPTQQALRDRILEERLFELTYEAKRRQDLVRHGKFTDPWTFKNESEPFRILFPVPQVQLDANPNMIQNPGY